MTLIIPNYTSNMLRICALDSNIRTERIREQEEITVIFNFA